METWSRQQSRKLKKKRSSHLEIRVEFWAEMRLAARWAGYTWREFRDLPANPRWMGPFDEENQAGVLVLYRLDQTLDAVREADKWL